MPWEKIHIDAAEPRRDATSGALYEVGRPTEVELARLPPAILCPNCGGVVDCVVPERHAPPTRTVPTPDGKRHMVSLPPCPVTGVEFFPFNHSARPCGCRVSVFWVSAYTGEVSRRGRGEVPEHVRVPEHERQKQLARLQRALTALYQVRDHWTTEAYREAAELWLPVVADQIARLCPGSHNRADSRVLAPILAGSYTHTELTDQANPEYGLDYPMPAQFRGRPAPTPELPLEPLPGPAARKRRTIRHPRKAEVAPLPRRAEE